MRSAEQVRRTPREWIDHQAAERQRRLAEHEAAMEQVRLERPEWYVWATEGQPELSEAEYERVSSARRRRR